MNFLILLAEADHFGKWDAADEEFKARHIRALNAFADAVRRRGKVIAGDALHRPETARSVQPTQPGKERMVTAGPFAETVEQLGGFYLVDLPDLGTAVELAKLLPREYLVEVRPALGVEV